MVGKDRDNGQVPRGEGPPRIGTDKRIGQSIAGYDGGVARCLHHVPIP